MEYLLCNEHEECVKQKIFSHKKVKSKYCNTNIVSRYMSYLIVLVEVFKLDSFKLCKNGKVVRYLVNQSSVILKNILIKLDGEIGSLNGQPVYHYRNDYIVVYEDKYHIIPSYKYCEILPLK